MGKFKEMIFYAVRNAILPIILGLIIHYFGTTTLELAKLGIMLSSLILWDIYSELVKIRKKLTANE